MKVAVVNLGCKVNRVESDSIALAYRNRGAELTDVAQADVIVVNTCTVTEEADKKTRKSIRRALRQNEHAEVLVTGCAAAVDPKFFKSLDSRVKVVDKTDLLDSSAEGADALSAEAVRVGEEFPTRVSVKIQDGCNHACTYCIVHVARGKAWSRPYAQIENEVLQLARAGVREVVLTGIDLGSYREEVAGQPAGLAQLCSQLLGKLDEQGFPDVRLRIGSIEPRSLDEAFIDLLASANGRICRHLHLPLQSGSDKVLREMHRPYRAQDFLRIVQELKQRVGTISLTTDIIVGFPGETEEDFRDTLALAREVGFSKIHVFRYSKRRGTPAAEREDQVDPEVKEQRAHQLIELGDELRLQFAWNLVGTTDCIVVEKQGTGMSEYYFKVHTGTQHQPGFAVHSRLTGVDDAGIMTI